MQTVKRPARGRKPAKPAKTYFDRDQFAEDVCRELALIWRGIYRRLDDDPLTTTEQFELFYQHSDKVHGAHENGWLAIREARSNAAARRAALDLQRRSAILVGRYLADEADREAAEAEMHREVLRQFPDLADEPYLLIGGWVIHGGESAKPKTVTRSFFRRGR